jgi:hypothetical protein
MMPAVLLPIDTIEIGFVPSQQGSENSQFHFPKSRHTLNAEVPDEASKTVARS